MDAALRQRPQNPKLKAFISSSDVVLSLPPKNELQDVVRGAGVFLNVDAFIERVMEVGPRVCHIEFEHDADGGTGFLVGPDLVMTAHHVLERVIGHPGGVSAQQIPSDDVVLRFDYKVLSDGVNINPGVVHRLAPGSVDAWLVDYSPRSPVDELADPGTDLPDEDQLDFAVVRLTYPAGDDPVTRLDKEPGKRGWIQIPNDPMELAAGSALFILQHPVHLPLKWAFDPDSVIGYNANATRMTYRTSTLPGSSGAPCFDSALQVAALHQSGDPSFKASHNQGIPVSSVRALMEQRGHALP